MVISKNIIKQEMLMIFAKKTFYIETIIFPLSLTLITILSNSKSSGVDNIIAYISLLSMYGILQNMLIGSARSIEKELYQDTLSLHFLTNTNLWSISFNKMIANGFVGIINLAIIVSLSALFFPIKIHNISMLVLGFTALLFTSMVLSLSLSVIFLNLKSAYSINSIIVRVSLLITGIIIPLTAFPTWFMAIISLTGLPQVFSIIIYGLKGTEILPYSYMMILPAVLLSHILFGLKMFDKAEEHYLMKGGI